MSPPSRPVRHFEMPDTLAGKVHAFWFLLARRVLQVAVMLLFFGTAHWGWKLLYPQPPDPVPARGWRLWATPPPYEPVARPGRTYEPRDGPDLIPGAE